MSRRLGLVIALVVVVMATAEPYAEWATKMSEAAAMTEVLLSKNELLFDRSREALYQLRNRTEVLLADQERVVDNVHKRSISLRAQVVLQRSLAEAAHLLAEPAQATESQLQAARDLIAKHVKDSHPLT